MCFGALWLGWIAGSQSVAFFRDTQANLQVLRSLVRWNVWCPMAGNLKMALKRRAGRSCWSGTMVVFVDRAGGREELRAAVRNHKDDSQLLPWSPDKKDRHGFVYLLPHRKSSYSPEHLKTCKLQTGKRLSLGKQLCFLSAFQFELSERGTFLQCMKGKEVAITKHCPHGVTKPQLLSMEQVICCAITAVLWSHCTLCDRLC